MTTFLDFSQGFAFSPSCPEGTSPINGAWSSPGLDIRAGASGPTGSQWYFYLYNEGFNTGGSVPVYVRAYCV